MVEDLTEKIAASQNKFEKLVAKIPGYKGYKQKEQRRAADKLLRLYVARQYEEQLGRLNRIQFDLTTGGKLSATLTLERVVSKLQLLIDRLKTASYGYAGLFDAIKVDEAALDRLYEFDQSMLEGVAQVVGLLDKLEAAVQAEASTTAEAGELVALVERLNGTFSQRQDVIIK